MGENTVYDVLAEYIMFSCNKTTADIEQKIQELGLEYRKNKGIADVVKALKKARSPKMGFGKTELELSAFVVYLKHDVVKKKRL